MPRISLGYLQALEFFLRVRFSIFEKSNLKIKKKCQCKGMAEPGRPVLQWICNSWDRLFLHIPAVLLWIYGESVSATAAG